MPKKSILHSVGYAIDGLVHCLRTQKHMRLHFVLAFLVMIGAVVLHVQQAQLLALLFSVTLVIVAEMINTGIEVIVDMIKPTYDPRAKIVKDVAAGAVLLASMSAALIGSLVYFRSPVIQSLRGHAPLPHFNSNWPELAVESLLILLILFVAWRIAGAQGSILRSGPISGRAAFGFFAAVLIVVNPIDEVRVGSALLLVALVLLGRSSTRVQSARQIVLGAILGIMVPTLVIAAHYAARPAIRWLWPSGNGVVSRLNVQAPVSSPDSQESERS